MKSRDTFAPIGPYLVTKDEIADPHKVPIKLWVNGEVKQDFNTDDMAHKIPRCIEWVTSIHTLEPGDILATGTNHRGLSSFMDGDTVELECGGLGKLSFKVRDELKRTWSRETRLDRQEKGLRHADAADRREIRAREVAGLGGLIGHPPPTPSRKGRGSTFNIQILPLPLREGVGGRGSRSAAAHAC